MVPKLLMGTQIAWKSFRAVLFRMVPKPSKNLDRYSYRFRAVLFRMVPKPIQKLIKQFSSFRAVLFRMVPKPF